MQKSPKTPRMQNPCCVCRVATLRDSVGAESPAPRKTWHSAVWPACGRFTILYGAWSTSENCLPLPVVTVAMSPGSSWLRCVAQGISVAYIYIRCPPTYACQLTFLVRRGEYTVYMRHPCCMLNTHAGPRLRA